MPFTAIFGGTFNPFHNGHYEMLKALNDSEFVSRIMILPDKIPPHKAANSLINDADRIKICEIVAENFIKAEVSTIEFERHGKSYTYDTVKILKEIYPNDNFAFVCGGDMLIYFDKWYKADELMKMLPFIVFSRTSDNKAEFELSLKKLKNDGMEIILMDNVIPNISSTQFRNTLKKEMLPEKVFEYLKDRGLYGL